MTRAAVAARATARFFRVVGGPVLRASWQAASAFNLDDVSQKARSLANDAFKPASGKLPPEIENLTYDQFRDIRFKPARMLWHGSGLPFEIAFFHQGLFFREPVRINELAPDGPHPVVFDPSLFDYGANPIDLRRARGLAFPGFASTTPSTRRSTRTKCSCSSERATFAHSARASTTACRRADWRSTRASRPARKFPRFVEFWIERPRAEREHADDLRSARFAAHDRSLSLRPEARRRHGDGCEGARLPARERDQARRRTTDQHVFLRRKPALDQRRLPTRGSRLRRAVDRVRDGRMDLAAAGQSAAPARDVVRADQSGGLRSDAARPLLRRLPGSRGTLRAAAGSVGRAEGRVGRRKDRAGGDTESERDQRQYRRLLDSGWAPSAEDALRLRISPALAERHPHAAAVVLGHPDASRAGLCQGGRRHSRLRDRLRRARAAQAPA